MLAAFERCNLFYHQPQLANGTIGTTVASDDWSEDVS